jgi:hypothetical protein
LNYENLDWGISPEEWQSLVRKALMDLFPDEARAHWA